MKTQLSVQASPEAAAPAVSVRVLMPSKFGHKVQAISKQAATSPMAGLEWGGCSCWAHN